MAKIRQANDGTVHFECPGCDCMHGIPVRGGGRPMWSWNGSFGAPTFMPSILIHYQGGDKPMVCHSIVTDGKIQFLSDCTHALAGKTVDLPDQED